MVGRLLHGYGRRRHAPCPCCTGLHGPRVHGGACVPCVHHVTIKLWLPLATYPLLMLVVLEVLLLLLPLLAILGLLLRHRLHVGGGHGIEGPRRGPVIAPRGVARSSAMHSPLVADNWSDCNLDERRLVWCGEVRMIRCKDKIGK